MDTKTGENQTMKSLTDDMKAKLKEHFKEQITKEKEFKDKLGKLDPKRNNPTILAVCDAVSNDYIETMLTFQLVFDLLLELNDETMDRALKLETAVREISDKTGIELSGVKNQVAELKNAVHSPMIDKVASFIETMEKEYEKRKNAGEQYVE
jgi:hypothetical protein